MNERGKPPFEIDKRVSLLAQAINSATGNRALTDGEACHRLMQRLSPSNGEAYNMNERPNISKNVKLQSHPVGLLDSPQDEKTRTRSRWQALLSESKNKVKVSVGEPGADNSSSSAQSVRVQERLPHLQDEEGWVSFGNCHSSVVDSTLSSASIKGSVQVSSSMAATRAAEEYPTNDTVITGTDARDAVMSTTKPLSAQPIEPNCMGTQTEVKAADPSAQKPPKTKTISVQIDFPESGTPPRRKLQFFKRSRSITPTRYRKVDMTSKPSNDDNKVMAKAGKTLSKSQSTEMLVRRRGRSRREESPSPERKQKSGGRKDGNMRRSKSHGNLADSQVQEKVIRGKSRANLREITPKVVNKSQLKSEVTQESDLHNNRKPRLSRPPPDEKRNQSKGKTDNAEQNDKIKETKKNSNTARDRQTKEKKDNQTSENNLDTTAGEKREKKFHDKNIAEINSQKGGSKRERKRRRTPKVPRDEQQGDDNLKEEDKDDKRKQVDSTVSIDNKPSKVERSVAGDNKSDQPAVEDNNKNDTITREEAEMGDKAKVDEKIVTESDNANREVEIELPPGVDDSYNELEDMLAAAGGDDSEIRENLDPELLKRTEDQIFQKIKFYKEVLDGVKHKTWTLRKKMKMLKEAREYTAKFEGKLSKSGGPGQLAQLKVTLHKASRELSNYAALLVPWEGRIKHIEMYFGSVVASYFTFLRWIFWTNIIQAVIVGAAIMAPEVMFGPDFGTVDHKTIPANETDSAAYLKTMWDFEGYAKYSPLFYGYYSSIKRFSSGYRMPLAYLIGNLAIFAYSFIAILRQVAANAKGEKAADKDDNFTFSWKTFAIWDYMIGNAETAKNKFKSVMVSIRESITEQKEATKKISKKKKALRWLANFLVLMVLGASTYAIYLTVKRSREFETLVKEKGPDAINAWQQNEISVVMSLVTSFFPMLFDMIAAIEDYHPRIALQYSLYRILTLYLLNLYTLYIALYWKIQDIQTAADAANATYYEGLNLTEVVFCSDVQTVIVTDEIDYSNVSTIQPYLNATEIPCLEEFIPETTCWETMIGQELFKLTMFDLVTTIALIYVTEFLRAIFIKFLNACWCWDLERNFPGYATFSLAENLLHLVYNQGMIWMGTLFAPGLPAFNLLKLLAMFYVRAWSVMVCNVPEEQIFKAGSDNFYLLILLFMLYVVMVPIAFAMVTIRTSKICGPFREVEYMYLALTQWMDEVLPSIINSVLAYISSPGALIPIFILLFLILNYLKSNNEALQGTVLDLKKQLSYERTEGKKRVFAMADTSKQTNATANGAQSEKKKPVAAASSMLALKALSRMGAFTKDPGANDSMNGGKTVQQQVQTTSDDGVMDQET